MQPSRKPKKSELPDWRNKLKAILKVLDKMTGTKLTHEQLQKLGIQLFDLDFATGKTSRSTISYFMPSQQDIDIANSGIDAAEDDFAKSCRSRHRKVHGDHGWPPFIMPFQDIYLLYPISTRLSGKTCMLTIPKYKTTCLTDRLTLVDWNNSSDPTKKGRLFAHGRGGFRLHAAGGIRSGLQPHRILSITINDYGDERCPSVSELVSLVSWMLASMNYQTLEKTKKRPSRSHEIFPVCFFFLFLFLLFF